jgi:hypothetical protein
MFAPTDHWLIFIKINAFIIFGFVTELAEKRTAKATVTWTIQAVAASRYIQLGVIAAMCDWINSAQLFLKQ